MSRGLGAGPGRGDITLIRDGELTLLGLMPNASNYTFLGEVSDGASSALVVYKPRRGESPLWDFPPGTLHRREAAAYLLAEALGWPSVPPTVVRDGPHGPGSVQLFIDADYTQHFFSLRDERLQEFAPVAAFDVVANNADRKGGHCLVGPDGRIWVIDHGVCFAVAPKLRTVIWEFAGAELPADLSGDLRRVGAALRNDGDRLRARMLELLSPEEVAAAAARAEALAAAARFPLPTSDRPYPWPAI